MVEDGGRLRGFSGRESEQVSQRDDRKETVGQEKVEKNGNTVWGRWWGDCRVRAVLIG